MRAIVLLILLAGLASCDMLKKSGEAVCDGHHVVAEGISDAGSYLGGPGSLVADILNAVLEIGCRVFKATVAIPADIADGPVVTVDGPKDGTEAAHPQ